MITFTELEVILMIGWLITVLAFRGMARRAKSGEELVVGLNHILEGVADRKFELSRDKEDRIHVKKLTKGETR